MDSQADCNRETFDSSKSSLLLQSAPPISKPKLNQTTQGMPQSSNFSCNRTPRRDIQLPLDSTSTQNTKKEAGNSRSRVTASLLIVAGPVKQLPLCLLAGMDLSGQRRGLEASERPAKPNNPAQRREEHLAAWVKGRDWAKPTLEGLKQSDPEGARRHLDYMLGLMPLQNWQTGYRRSNTYSSLPRRIRVAQRRFIERPRLPSIPEEEQLSRILTTQRSRNASPTYIAFSPSPSPKHQLHGGTADFKKLRTANFS